MDDREELPKRLLLSLLDEDPDYLLIHVSVSDGSFAGSTEVYDGVDIVSQLRVSLAGFPRANDDQREIVLGAFGPQHAGGGVRLMFKTIDRAGHAILEAELEDGPTAEGSPRSVVVRLPIDSVGIDNFLQALGQLRARIGGTAILHGAT